MKFFLVPEKEILIKYCHGWKYPDKSQNYVKMCVRKSISGRTICWRNNGCILVSVTRAITKNHLERELHETTSLRIHL